MEVTRHLRNLEFKELFQTPHPLTPAPSLPLSRYRHPGVLVLLDVQGAVDQLLQGVQLGGEVGGRSVVAAGGHRVHGRAAELAIHG